MREASSFVSSAAKKPLGRLGFVSLLIYSSSLSYLIIFFSLAPESAYRAYRNFQHLLMSVGFVCLPLDCLLQRYVVGFMICIIAIILLDIIGLLKGLRFFTRLAYT